MSFFRHKLDEVGSYPAYKLKTTTIEALEKDGFVVVDAELYKALVDAILAEDNAIQTSCVNPDASKEANVNATDLLLRALKLLKEKGTNHSTYR